MECASKNIHEYEYIFCKETEVRREQSTLNKCFVSLETDSDVDDTSDEDDGGNFVLNREMVVGENFKIANKNFREALNELENTFTDGFTGMYISLLSCTRIFNCI